MKYLYTILSFLFVTKLFGQEIKGKVVDKDNKPLEFVSVLIKKDSIKILSTITDSQGEFNFTKRPVVLPQKYQLTLSLVGYKTIDTVVNVGAPFKTVMHVHENQLKSVSVVSKKNILERKIDRLIFNVENNVNTAGLNALDILSKTPMVRVENDGISLIGKESVNVMLDNRILHLSPQELSNLLKSIGADNISEIEVITNPPAQYDAEGNSGLINIVTKKTKLPGYSGSVNTTLSHNTYTFLGEGLNLNYNVKKLLLFGSLNSGHGANGPTNSNTRFYDTQTWSQTIKNKEKSNFLGGTFGFEYLLSKNTAFGASVFHSTSRPDVEGSSSTNIINNTRKTSDSILTAQYKDPKLFNATTVNLHLNQKLDSNKTNLVFDIDYFKSATDIHYNSFNQNLFPDGSPTTPGTEVQSQNNQDSRGLTFNAEVDMHFKKSSVTFGAKTSFLQSNSGVNFFRDIDKTIQIDSATLDHFQFNEKIEAIFGSFQTSFGKFELQTGLRTEATQTKGFSESLSQTNTNSYIGFFPTLYITYAISSKDILSANYGRRIGRPSFSSFNPFRVYYNQYDYSTGNPYLKPSYSNNFEISNTFNQILNTSFSYTVNKGLTAGVQIIQNGSNASIGTVDNSNSSKTFSLDNSISLNPLKWWETTNSASVYYIETHSTSPYKLPELSGYGADISSSNSLHLNTSKTLIGSVDFMYQFPYTSGLSHTRKNYRIDLSSSYLLFEKKLQITAALRDIFKTRTVISSTITNGLESRSTANNDSRRAVISLRYNFGNTKQRKGQGHSVSGEEQGQAGR
ncbi:MAG: outer membrane beta-barrel protein [Mucilaginibacter sp.]